MLWPVIDDLSDSVLKIEVEENKMIGARFGLTESGSASRPGRFHLNRATVMGEAVDCLMRFGFDKLYVEKVYGQCLTKITYQVAVERE